MLLVETVEICGGSGAIRLKKRLHVRAWFFNLTIAQQHSR
jgi:hypothetical protein